MSSKYHDSQQRRKRKMYNKCWCGMIESSNCEWLSSVYSPSSSILNSKSFILHPPTSIFFLFKLNSKSSTLLFPSSVKSTGYLAKKLREFQQNVRKRRLHRLQLFPGLCVWSKDVFYQRWSSIKGCLPSQVIYLQRSSIHQNLFSIEVRFQSKVFFHRRPPSIEGCLPSLVILHQSLSSWRLSSVKFCISIKFCLPSC